MCGRPAVDLDLLDLGRGGSAQFDEIGADRDRIPKWFGKGKSEAEIRFIRANVKVIDDVVLVRENGRNGWKRVDLMEANFIVP